MIVYRQCDHRFPFLWETATQPSARWHRDGEGPAQYLADTPAGAWAEFLRHEEITDPADLAGIERALWAVEIDETEADSSALAEDALKGDQSSYALCQDEARRLRDGGSTALVAPSAALKSGAARGWRVEHGFRAGPDADGSVYVLFGDRPNVLGWLVVDRGRPSSEVLGDVAHF